MRYAFPGTMFALAIASGWAGCFLLDIARRFPQAPGAYLALTIGLLLAVIMLGFAALAGQDLAEQSWKKKLATRRRAW